MKQQFLDDVKAGLSRSPKRLSSKYFYDKRGDELFMQIMALPEYYLTRAEMEIFTQQTDQMIDLLGVDKDIFFELVELGAGDGSKTKSLLKRLLQRGFQFEYFPVDISDNVLDHLEATLSEEMPELVIKPQHKDYFQSLGELKQTHHAKVVLYLGSNLGNLDDQSAAQFLYDLGANLVAGDKLLLGLDRLKSKEIVAPAYNDSQGVTRDFNLNLLVRMNRELGANFNPDNFIHMPIYSEQTGIAASSLQSTCAQDVYIAELDETYHFAKDEKIHLEISRKYNDEILQGIIRSTDFIIGGELRDSKGYFSDYILLRQ